MQPDVKREVPPNFEDICAVFPGVREHKGAVFTYEPAIYAPNLGEKKELAPHHIIHELVHLRQQKEAGGPKVWWDKWLSDVTFRAEQESEAYNAQYHFVKTNHGGKRLEDFLFQLSCDLSGELYGNMMSYGRAEAQIRRQK